MSAADTVIGNGKPGRTCSVDSEDSEVKTPLGARSSRLEAVNCSTIDLRVNKMSHQIPIAQGIPYIANSVARTT